MNPFPQTILTPVTANRIPRTENADEVVAKLLEFGINASVFFMEADQLDALENENFANDFDRAFEDFFYQIPAEIRGQVFPPPPDEESSPATPEEPPPSGSGMAANRQPQTHRQKHGLSL
jgi:hypothetical protein